MCGCSGCIWSLLRNVWLYLHRKYCYRLWGRGGHEGASGCFVTFVTSPSRHVALNSTNYSQLWPTRVDCRVNPSPLFTSAAMSRSWSKTKMLADRATGCRPTGPDFLEPFPVFNASSVPTVYWVTSCGSRLCEWGLTPPLVSGHWWSPPTFRGTPLLGPGTHGKCRNRSPGDFPPAWKQTQSAMRNML